VFKLLTGTVYRMLHILIVQVTTGGQQCDQEDVELVVYLDLPIFFITTLCNSVIMILYMIMK
jgi:hypothetical protein